MRKISHLTPVTSDAVVAAQSALGTVTSSKTTLVQVLSHESDVPPRST